jgi:hypothetical protein
MCYRTGGTSGAWASRPGFFKLTHYPSFRPELKPRRAVYRPKASLYGPKDAPLGANICIVPRVTRKSTFRFRSRSVDWSGAAMDRVASKAAIQPETVPA